MVRPDVALRVRGGIMSEGLAIHMEEVAKILMGDPVPAHSKPGKPRYGNNGSLAIDIRAGLAFDHEAQEGGGVLWLIERMTGNKGRDAIAWMSEHGIRVDDPDTPARYTESQGRANGHAERREEPRAEKAAPEPSQKADKPKREIKATYDYHATDGTLLYQVVRFEPKGFAQRRPDPQAPGKWIWNLEGIEHTLYRLPELQEPLVTGVVTVLVEGEKDADTLTAWGVPATTNSGGAKHWSERHAEHFRGSDVVIVPDNDDAGRAGAEIKAKSLAGIAKRVRILDLAKVVEGFPHKGDVTDWRDQCGGNVDALYDLIAKAPDWKPVDEKPKSKLGLIFWSDIERDIKRHSFLVDEMITEGEVAMIGGDSGAGKTFLTLDMAFSVARGVKFLDRYDTRQGGVVYQVGEGPTAVRTVRIPAYMRHHGITATDRLPLAVIGHRVNLFRDDADTDALVEDLKIAADYMGCPVRMLVIDTVSKATTGADENSGRDVGPVLARCQRIRDATGATVLLVAHTSMGGSKIRGHTSWRADVDSVLMCSRRLDPKTNEPNSRDAHGREIRDLLAVKVKDGEDGWKVPFVLRGHTLGQRENGKPITSCTIERPDMGLLREDTRESPANIPALSDKPFNYLKAIKKAIDEYGEAPPAGVLLPPHVVVVHKKHVRAAYDAIYPGEEEEPEKRAQNIRKARERLGETLLARGFIGQANPYMWLTAKAEKRLHVTPRAQSVTDDQDPVTNGSANVTNPGDPVTDEGDWLSQIDDAGALG
jgi:hypothetical protein